MKNRAIRIAMAAMLAAACGLAQKAAPKPKQLKPGFNLFSKDQDVQMGREYAAQVEKEMPVVKDPELNAFVERIGRKLASAPEAKDWPLTFKVVQEKSINAFALPGGPTFTHTGLITAADNEGQIAGVLAHEIGHVVLRHGTNQASKANLIQLPAMIGAQMAGGGLVGTLAQLGVGLGANSLLLKFSRNAERDADLIGTRIMHGVGYNPIEMARFFEKLEAESGKGNWISNMMASHPNPGSRVKSVQDEIRLLPQRAAYDAESGDLAAIKKRIQGLPEVKVQPPQQQAAGGDPRNISAARPSNRLRAFQHQEVAFNYPENWETFQNNQSGEVTLAPKAGIFQNGAIAYGAIVNIVQTQTRDLGQNTQQLVAQFQKRDQSLKVNGQARQFRLGNANAMAVRLQSPSAFEGAQEADILVTVDHKRGMFYMLLIAPEPDLSYAQPVFDQIIGSIQVP